MSRLVKVTAGSLQDAIDNGAANTGSAVMDALLRVEMIVLLDQSGSMNGMDTRDGRSRFDVAEDELAKLQARYPGKLALVEFSDVVNFLPGGVPTRIGSSTNMIAALRWLEALGVGDAFTVVLISDGEPTEGTNYGGDPETDTIHVARGLNCPINTIYIGEEAGPGEEFLRRLAGATSGRQFEADKPGELMPGILALLGSGD